MAVDLLEYLIRLQGAEIASAEVKGLRDDFAELGAAAKDAGRVSNESAASAAGAHKGHGRASAAAGDMGAAMGKIAKVGGLALLGLGVVATKMSMNFQTGMLRIRTEGGATEKEFNRMRASLVQLGQAGYFFNQGPESVVAGLYHLESMGIRGKKALLALHLATAEAAISGANLEDTTTSLGGALFIAAKGTGSLKQVMGTLNAIAGSGNMRFQDLNEALGTGLLGAAKTAGISLQSVGAALDVLTDSGYKASSAGAQLGTALHYLYAPTSKAAGALASIGLTGDQLAKDLRKPNGIFVALADLHDHMKGLGAIQQQDLMAQILPGGRGRVLTNLYQLQYRGGQKYHQIENTSSDFGAHMLQQMHNLGTKLGTDVSKLGWSMVSLGNAIEKIVVPAAQTLLKILALLLKVITAVASWFLKMGPLAKALATFIGVLSAAFLAYKIATTAATIATAAFDAVMDANPITLVIIALAALAAGVVYAYTKFSWFRAIVAGVWHFLEGSVVAVVNWVGKHWKLLLSILGGPFVALPLFIATHFNQVLKFLKGIPGAMAKIGTEIWDGLKSGMVAAINWIIGKLNDLIKGFDDIAGKIPFFGKHLKIGMIGKIGDGSGASGAGLHNRRPPAQPGGMSSATTNRFTSPNSGSTSNGKTPWAHGDIVVNIGRNGERELARVTRRQMQNAMMG